MTLRPYQREAVDGVLRQWEEHQSTLLVMPTGTGKTRVFSEVLALRSVHGRALVLAHRDELLTQAARAMHRDAGLSVEVEQAQSFASVHGGLLGGSDVVVASVQTLHKKRRQRWPKDAFATVVVDEAHHAAAKSYRDILRHFETAKILGVTATPDRGDGVGLRAVFASVAFEYEIRQAIRDKWLSPIVQRAIYCADLDLSDVKSTRGDLSEADLQQALSVDKVLHQIAGPLVQEAGDRPTVVFTAGVQQAHALAGVLSGYVGESKVGVVDGAMPKRERQEALDAYQQGRTQFMVNVGVLTEGFDAPHTACVAMARPTKSRALYAQMLGRGTRLAPGKDNCLVLDFVGNAGRHALVSAGDVLAGRPLPGEIKKAVERKQREEGMDLDAAIEAAEEEARRRLEEERLRRMRRHVRAEVTYAKKEIDPFGIFDGIGGGNGPRATDKQLDLLRKWGVNVEKTPSRREASQMIDRLAERRKRGICSYKQAALLAKYGLPTDVGFKEASDLITIIKQNGWTVPAAVRRRYAEAG